MKVVIGVLGWSGVLSTVASSLTLASFMWPHIVNEQAHLIFYRRAIGNEHEALTARELILRY